MGLPVYEIIIDTQHQGIDCVSFVEKPAIEQDFEVRLSEEKIKLSYNEGKREVSGCMLRVNKPIYRCSEEGYEYYIIITKEEAYKARTVFMKKQLNSAVSVEHNGLLLDGVYLTEIFSLTSEMLALDKYKNNQEGDIFATYKVENDLVWNDVLEGKYKGFSIEGLFNFKEIESVKFSSQSKEKNIISYLLSFIGLNVKDNNKIKELNDKYAEYLSTPLYEIQDEESESESESEIEKETITTTIVTETKTVITESIEKVEEEKEKEMGVDELKALIGKVKQEKDNTHTEMSMEDKIKFYSSKLGLKSDVKSDVKPNEKITLDNISFKK